MVMVCFCKPVVGLVVNIFHGKNVLLLANDTVTVVEMHVKKSFSSGHTGEIGFQRGLDLSLGDSGEKKKDDWLCLEDGVGEFAYSSSSTVLL